jgi:glycosyltransferase involved in cell wall biosynthesis
LIPKKRIRLYLQCFEGPTEKTVMRIAQVAPLFESVPPKLYGGTERVVSYLTEALVQAGHEVTLFASGDSVTSARLIPGCSKSLRLNYQCFDQLAHHYVMLEQVMERVDEFDIIHFHCDYLHYPLSKHSGIPHISTLHGRLDLPDLFPLYGKYKQMPVVSISQYQRKPLSWINWVGNVYHGLPLELLAPGDGSGGYLAFLGRISPEKRVDRAIEIATRLGLPLKIAAKVDPKDRTYYEREIKPLLKRPNIEFVGEIGEHEKTEFLGKASVYLFPIDWPEPFGLTMIESMACGTPSVAFKCGSVPEVISDGVSGFIVEDMDQAVKATKQAMELDRTACRRDFETRFSATRMARDYVRLYEAALTPKAPAVAASELDSLLTL